MKSIVDYVAPNFHARPENIHNVPIPDALAVDPSAVELARAFTKQMLDNTPDLPTPFIGEFRMTRTGVDLVDALNLQEIRFVITNTGLWFSLIFQDDTFCPAWWSPFGDTLIINFGQRYSWIFRTFLACIWHDLHITEESVFHVSRDRKRFTKGSKVYSNERIISLPRKVRHLTWDDGMTRHFEEGRGDYSVRAHYRRLHDEHWQASDEAVIHARQSGFPEPPDGYTFVRAYDVGAGSDNRPPRIIAKGLHAAKVALSDL